MFGFNKKIKKAIEKTEAEFSKQFQRVASDAYKRGFDAARINRLSSSFYSEVLSMDDVLRMELRVIRGRARNLNLNNDYAKEFIRLLKINVVGHKGVTIVNEAKKSSDEFDESANDLIMENFKEWSKKEYASTSGKLSFVGLCQLFITTFAIDGEVLFRRLKGYNNKFGYAVQHLDSDSLDINLNQVLDNGNEIKMGIEFNKFGKPLRYYLKKKNFQKTGINSYEVVDADEIIHAFIYENASQSRGVPPMSSPMISMHSIHAAEEAEIYAVRGAAAKMGFYLPPEDGDSTYSAEKEGEDLVQNAEPGAFEILPKGWKFETYDPNHPNGNFPLFKKECLKSIAAGLGTSYHALAKDLEGVNYSSGRIGSLDERDYYKILQIFLVEEFCIPIFTDLLEMSLLNQTIKLPFADLDKLNKPVFYPRSWDWVDPAKDAKAAEISLKNKLKSRTEIAAERGKDIYDIFKQIKQEQEWAKELGISLDVVDEKIIKDKGDDEDD